MSPVGRPDVTGGPTGDGAVRTVVVASERPADPARVARAGVLVRRLSTALEQLASLRVVAVWLEPGDTATFWARVARVEPAVAIVLDDGESSLAARVRGTGPPTGGPVVLDARDASAVVLTAATLVAVNQRRRRTGVARVLIVGSDRLPGLNPLLFAANVSELTLWNTSDAAFVPLHRVADGVDVVINLSGPDAGSLPPGNGPSEVDHDGPVAVLEPDRWTDPLLVLPALAHTLANSTWVRADLPGLDLAYHDMCYACALELVMATPGQQTRLPGPSRPLHRRLADAAAHALAPARSRRPRDG